MNLDIQTKEELEAKKLNYVKVGQVLSELGYLPFNLAPDSVERELLFDLWNILKGEETDGVTVGNLRVMLLAIQGIVLDDMIFEDQKTVDTNRTSTFHLKCDL